jgi:hypothetical protein
MAVIDVLRRASMAKIALLLTYGKQEDVGAC